MVISLAILLKWKEITIINNTGNGSLKWTGRINYNGNFTRYFVEMEGYELKVDEFNTRDSENYRNNDTIGIEFPKAPHIIAE